MIKCTHIQKRLSLYQDGACKAAERKQIEAHLTKCESCSTMYADMQKAWDILEVLPSAAPQPFAATRIQAKLESETQKKIHPWPARLGLAATVSVALIFGVFAGSQWPSNSNNNITANQWAEELQLETLADLPQNSLSALYFDTQNSLDQGGVN